MSLHRISRPDMIRAHMQHWIERMEVEKTHLSLFYYLEGQVTS